MHVGVGLHVCSAASGKQRQGLQMKALPQGMIAWRTLFSPTPISRNGLCVYATDAVCGEKGKISPPVPVSNEFGFHGCHWCPVVFHPQTPEDNDDGTTHDGGPIGPIDVPFATA